MCFEEGSGKQAAAGTESQGCGRGGDGKDQARGHGWNARIPVLVGNEKEGW
jgi:hypothetical protein